MGNIIKLHTHERTFTDCKHMQCEVDVTKNELKCTSCGESINPMWYLDMLARVWSRTHTGNAQRLELIEEIKSRNRCKCTHCGKLTKIIRNAE